MPLLYLLGAQKVCHTANRHVPSSHFTLRRHVPIPTQSGSTSLWELMRKDASSGTRVDTAQPARACALGPSKRKPCIDTGATQLGC